MSKASDDEQKEKLTQWNIRNVPTELDKEIKIFLATNNMKLYSFVIEAVKEKLNSGK